MCYFQSLQSREVFTYFTAFKQVLFYIIYYIWNINYLDDFIKTLNVYYLWNRNGSNNFYKSPLFKLCTDSIKAAGKSFVRLPFFSMSGSEKKNGQIEIPKNFKHGPLRLWKPPSLKYTAALLKPHNRQDCGSSSSPGVH